MTCDKKTISEFHNTNILHQIYWKEHLHFRSTFVYLIKKNFINQLVGKNETLYFVTVKKWKKWNPIFLSFCEKMWTQILVNNNESTSHQNYGRIQIQIQHWVYIKMGFSIHVHFAVLLNPQQCFRHKNGTKTV